jgi:hypothetical protein
MVRDALLARVPDRRLVFVAADRGRVAVPYFVDHNRGVVPRLANVHANHKADGLSRGLLGRCLDIRCG